MDMVVGENTNLSDTKFIVIAYKLYAASVIIVTLVCTITFDIVPTRMLVEIGFAVYNFFIILRFVG